MVSTAFVNDPKNADAVRAALGKFIPLPAPILASLQFGKWKAKVTPQGIGDWLETMTAQDMMQGAVDANKVIWK